MQTNENTLHARYKTELAAFIEREYGLAATSIVPAKRGYYGETWRMDTADGRYFLKLDNSAASEQISQQSGGCGLPVRLRH